MTEAALIGGSIFLVMMASQYGYRDYTWHKVVMPLISVAAFGYFYLKDAPTSTVDLVVYLVGAVIGLGFGVVATLTTRVGRDPRTHAVMTRCGVGFLITWLVALAVRLAFIWSAENVSSFRNALGEFMFRHDIVEAAIPPFFVLMALVMVASRVALIGYQVSRLPATAVSTDAAATPVAAPAHR